MYNFQNTNLTLEQINNENINISQLWVWAIRFNHLDIVKILSSKISYCPGLLDIVAEYGYIEMLIWLYDNRSENFTTETIHLAAKNGHTQVVDFLYNNLPNNLIGLEKHLFNAMNDAVKYNHLEIMKWLYYNTDNIIYESLATLQIAQFHGYTDIVNWLTNEVCGR